MMYANLPYIGIRGQQILSSRDCLRKNWAITGYYASSVSTNFACKCYMPKLTLTDETTIALRLLGQQAKVNDVWERHMTVES